MEKIKTFYNKYREIINYALFGVVTMAVSLSSYSLFVSVFGLGLMIGKALSWACAVMVAFVTNKLWVFSYSGRDARTVLREAASFFAARLATGLVEILGLPFLVYLGLDRPIFGVDGMAANLTVTVVVIILNYVLSKFFVFRKRKQRA